MDKIKSWLQQKKKEKKEIAKLESLFKIPLFFVVVTFAVQWLRNHNRKNNQSRFFFFKSVGIQYLCNSFFFHFKAF